MVAVFHTWHPPKFFIFFQSFSHPQLCFIWEWTLSHNFCLISCGPSFCSHIKQFHPISILLEKRLPVLIPLPQPKETKNWRRNKCFFYSEELKSLREQTFLMSIRSFENSGFAQKKKKSKPLMKILAAHFSHNNKWNSLEAKQAK